MIFFLGQMKSHSWLVNFVGFGNNLDYSSSENGAFIIKKGFDGPFAKGKGVWFGTGYGVFFGPSIARLPGKDTLCNIG